MPIPWRFHWRKQEDQRTWVEARAANWADAVGAEMDKVAERYPQTAYAGMQKSIQQEWQYLQGVTDGLGEELDDIEQAMNDKFCPAILGIESVSETKQQLACLPVKHSGLALPNPTTTAESNWKASTLICGHLVAALRGRTDFRSADHANIMAQGKAEIRKRSLEAHGTYMETILAAIAARKSRTIGRGTETEHGSLFCLPQSVGRHYLHNSFVMHFPCDMERLHPTFQLAATVVMPLLPFSMPSHAKRAVL
jgi:hypothetical protein